MTTRTARPLPDSWDDARAGDPVVVPASFTQERELRGAIDERAWRTAAIRWQIEGDVVPDRFRSALREVVRRHDALRTRLATFDGNVVQVVEPELSMPFRYVDLSHLRDDERSARSAAVEAEALARPFLLTEAPLWQACLVRRSPSDHVFVMTVAHTIWDAASSSVFCHEIEQLYTALARDPDATLTPLPIQLGDWAAWEATVSDPTAERYWCEQLVDWPHARQLPIERARRSPDAGFTIGLVVLDERPPQLAAALRVLAHDAASTLPCALLAGFVALLHHWSASTCIPVGVADANRDAPESRSLIGDLVTHVPVRGDIANEPTFRDLLGRLSRTMFSTYANLPSRRLLERCIAGSAAWRRGQPLWEATFNCRPVEATDRRGVLAPDMIRFDSNPAVSYRDYPVRSVSWDGIVDLNVDVLASGALGGELTFNEDVVDAATARWLAAAYGELLEALVRSPDVPVTQVTKLLR